MGLRDLGRRLTASTQELHHDRLRDEFAARSGVAIAEAPERAVVVLGGEVQGVQVVPRAGSPTLEVTVHDGTGRAVAVFTGRRAIGGISPGRHLQLSGMTRRQGNRLVMVNPEYTLFP